MAVTPVPDDLNRALRRLLADPNIASKEWVYRQYDQTVMTNTVVSPGLTPPCCASRAPARGLP